MQFEQPQFFFNLEDRELNSK